jgi:hypothetical protein
MNMNLSDKFSTMMEKFFIWTEENEYVLTDMVNGSKVEWNMNLLFEFKEPGRNKIETFIKKLNKEYILMKESEKVLDIKLMVKNFKENKPKIVKNNSKKVLNNKKNSNSLSVFVDVTLDTSNTYNIDTLDYFTYELINALGKPEKITNEDSKYEWKLNIDGEIYSIYDWIENKEKFEDITWYLAGLNENIEKIKKIYEFIDNKNKKQSENSDIESENTVINTDLENENSVINTDEKNTIDTVDTTNTTDTTDTVDSIDMNELFGDEEDEQEINLDNINDDDTNLEIDIDNIDF